MPSEWCRKEDPVDWEQLLFSSARAGLKPHETESMTLRDVMIYIKARAAAEESEWERAAFVAATSANVHLPARHRLTIDKLLGRRPKKSGKPTIRISGIMLDSRSLRDKANDAQRTIYARQIWGDEDGHHMFDEKDDDEDVEE